MGWISAMLNKIKIDRIYIVLYYTILICTDNADYCLIDKVFLLIDTSRYPSYETSRIARLWKEILLEMCPHHLPYLHIYTHIRLYSVA